MTEMETLSVHISFGLEAKESAYRRLLRLKIEIIICLFMCISVLGCHDKSYEAISANENDYNLFLAGDSYSIKRYGLSAAQGLRVVPPEDHLAKVEISSYKVLVLRDKVNFREFEIEGDSFSDELSYFLQHEALSGDQVDFTDVVAMTGGNKIVFDRFFFTLK